jgi:prevent-host-death family protein
MSERNKMSKPQEVPVAEFKRNFHAYVAQVLGGRRVRVVRHGRPVGDFVPAGLSLTASTLPTPEQPGGLVALAGLFADWDSMDADIGAIVAARGRAGRRAAPGLD